MKLITPELEERFVEVGNQFENENPLFIARFFNPYGAQSWYLTHYEPETKICHGYVNGLIEERWGTFSIDDFKVLKQLMGIAVERDIDFKEKTYEEQILRKTKDRIEMLNSHKITTNNQELER